MSSTYDEDRASTVVDAARRAKTAAGRLARMGPEERDRVLVAIARALLAHGDRILSANAEDLAAARPLVDSGEMSEALFERLKLDATKLQGLVAGVEQVARMEDPLGAITLATELDEGLELTRVACPIGLVGVIFESRPDALVQIASLCIRSGNGVLLKGGREAERSNRALFTVLRDAASSAGLPAEALVLLGGREDVAALLQAHDSVDLIIPRGSNALVRYVQANTLIPVLGHAEGICHVYVDAAADPEKALRILVDAKTQYPAACNAMETLLVHESVAPALLPAAVARLRERGVEIRLDAKSSELSEVRDGSPASEADWATEHSDLVLAIRTVGTLDEAIAHINRYGSHHTDAIVTEDDAAWSRFFAEVDSAGVYRNASTRFADGFRYGFGAEVGISTGKLHPRGPVGLEGLVTYKYKLVGDGHIVADYSGGAGRRFTHRKLPLDRS